MQLNLIMEMLDISNGAFFQGLFFLLRAVTLMAVLPMLGASQSIYLGAAVDLPTKVDRFYQLELSEDLENWEGVGNRKSNSDIIELRSFRTSGLWFGATNSMGRRLIVRNG
jgi:hypothetical protein